MRKHRLAGAIAAVATLVLAAACSNDDGVQPSVTGNTQSYIAGVSFGTVSAAFTGIAVPVASGGPLLSILGNPNVVNGGTNLVNVTSVEAFTHLYVSVSSLSGYYDVVMPAPATSATLIVSFAQSLPTTSFVFSVSAVDAAGAVGTASTIASTVTTVGTGDVQITLSWDVNSDLDLHVVEPSGEEIYWNSRVSASGGKLDLDSNAACTLDGVRNENITWATGTAPRGTYTVRVDMWSSCATPTTTDIVRVNVNGTATNYTGTFTGDGDRGGRGSGTVITTFTY